MSLVSPAPLALKTRAHYILAAEIGIVAYKTLQHTIKDFEYTTLTDDHSSKKEELNLLYKLKTIFCNKWNPGIYVRQCFLFSAVDILRLK